MSTYAPGVVLTRRAVLPDQEHALQHRPPDTAMNSRIVLSVTSCHRACVDVGPAHAPPAQGWVAVCRGVDSAGRVWAAACCLSRAIGAEC
eukprot:3262983-Rhodomonas_salina.1